MSAAAGREGSAPSSSSSSATKSTIPFQESSKVETQGFHQQQNLKRRPSSDASNVPPPDGGTQAWLFLAGSFTIDCMIWGFSFSYGAFEDYYTSRHIFANNSNIATIGTTATGIMYLGLPIVFLSFLRWPALRRYSTVAGLCVMTAALVASSFATSTKQLIGTQGVMYAIGGSAVHAPTVLFLDEWFIKKKGVAFGCMWAGTGLSGVGVPLIMEWALDKYDYKVALRGWAITVFIITALVLPFIRPRLPPSKRKSFDFGFLRSPVFVLLEMGNIVQSLGFFIPSVYLPSYARSLGASNYPATATIVLFNVATIVGCVLMGALVDRYNVTTCISFSALGSTLGVFLFWGLSSGLPLLYGFCIIFGIFAGSYASTWAGIMRLVSSKVAEAEPTLVFAFLATGRGIGNVVSGPISERLMREDPLHGMNDRGYGSGYGSIIIFTGVTTFFGGLSICGRAKRGLVS